jgi:hypothetical protein
MANADDTVPELTPEEQAGIAYYQAEAAKKHGARRAQIAQEIETYGTTIRRMRTVTASVDMQQADRLTLRMQLDDDDFVTSLITGAVERVNVMALPESTTDHAALAIPEWGLKIPPALISMDERIATMRRRLRKDRDVAKTALNDYIAKWITGGELDAMKRRSRKLKALTTPDAQQLGLDILDIERQDEVVRGELRLAEKFYDDWLMHEQDARVARMNQDDLDHVCPHCDSRVPYQRGEMHRFSTKIYCSIDCRNAYNPFDGVWAHRCDSCQRHFVAAPDYLSFGTVPHIPDDEFNQPVVWCRLACMLRAKIDFDDFPNRTPSLWSEVRYVPGPPRTAAARRKMNLRALAAAAYDRLAAPAAEPRRIGGTRVQSTPALTEGGGGDEAILIAFLSRTPGEWVTLDTIRDAKIGIRTVAIKPVALRLEEKRQIESKGKGGKGSPLSFRLKQQP